MTTAQTSAQLTQRFPEIPLSLLEAFAEKHGRLPPEGLSPVQLAAIAIIVRNAPNITVQLRALEIFIETPQHDPRPIHAGQTIIEAIERRLFAYRQDGELNMARPLADIVTLFKLMGYSKADWGRLCEMAWTGTLVVDKRSGEPL